MATVCGLWNLRSLTSGNPGPPILAAWSLNHQTTWKVPWDTYLNWWILNSKMWEFQISHKPLCEVGDFTRNDRKACAKKQEDYIKRKQVEQGWRWVVWRVYQLVGENKIGVRWNDLWKVINLCYSFYCVLFVERYIVT